MQNQKEENQAEKLKQLFEEVNNRPLKNEQKNQLEEQEYIEVDVLNLPPRKEVHTNPKSRLSISLKRPFVRIVVVVILLVSILLFIYFLTDVQFF